MGRAGDRGGIVSLLYNHNPFYLLSTALFVYGVKMFFRSGNSAVFFAPGSVAYMEPWGLLGSFAAITLLMSVTAILIVRIGGVWEDARSLVLIVLLMLLAIAVSLDEITNVLADSDQSPRHVFSMFAVGSLFSLIVVELLLRGLQIRLALAWRLPLHGFLQLFLLWPLLLLTEYTGLTPVFTRSLMTLFPVAATALTLCLLPAVRAGRVSVEKNGTPWRWPLFPWSPFVFLFVAVLFRSYTLTMSFDPVVLGSYYWNTVFSLYQMVPFLLGVCVILLEIGLTEKIPKLSSAVLWGVLLLIPLCAPGLAPWSNLPSYRSWTRIVTAEVASPLFIGLIAISLFYGWAWYRGCRFAEAGWLVLSAAAAVVGPGCLLQSGSAFDEMSFVGWPLLLPGLCSLWLGIRRRHSGRLIIGAVFSAAVLWQFPVVRQKIMALGDEGSVRWLSAIHAALFGVMLCGLVCRDQFARILKLGSPYLFAACMWLSTWILIRFGTQETAWVYFPLMLAAGAGLGKVLNDIAYLRMAQVQCALVLVLGIGGGIWVFLATPLADGVKELVFAVLAFAGGVLISCLKAGFGRLIKYHLARRRRLLRM